ncbi:MAG: bifunctional 2-keto-4-hydroxyglutarate aldolase/2-keto-3-deoxy-6-phosphogluconate aldolase [Bacillota bacterium]|jgi:2-dehydro-3-deoxyphosphogluconate aldolase/(4S)-4-hydroxy-2-oxoglutarate aldolase|nr:bifunctional 2-keto-4-hydroxyglutarate aldolase/2-keto-3-deoxy-6-phosphogluconate aldolase [Bacillota bacterium]NLV62910.1 bifunctional 2-keto-4-hydroxyglutarate aldolase/2-keto-3-deoxy-6-phosphogluconate aldolase [Clostridiaceae bacterium]
MKKEQVIARIRETGLVAVIRAENEDKAVRITEACLKGGVAAIEITFTVPGAHKVIESLANRFSNEQIILGAGTVLDPETARIAILSGASYIVSPSLNLDTVKLCNRYRIACMPGAMTIREVIECLESGADIIKIFPGELFGPKIIKSIKGPVPQAELMPTGGVTVDNAAEWIKAGAVALGAGSSLTAGAKTGDYDKITETAKLFIERIKQARM